MKLAALFCEHAVLQREVPIPVWGWTKPNTRIKVQLASHCVEYFSGMDGKFMVRFPAMSAGGPYELAVTEVKSGEKIVVRDVWVGEVWVASGQSNMEWTMGQVGLVSSDVLGEAQPSVRMINIPRNACAGRQSDVSAVWQVGKMPEITNFSAVAYYFAKELQDKLGVAVGIINSSWGGTLVEAWTSRETLSRNPDMAGRLARYEATTFTPEFWRDFPETEFITPPSDTIRADYPIDPGNDGVKNGWAQPDYNAADWKTMTLPASWTAKGHRYSGVFWFRKTIDIPASWAGKDLYLGIGAVDKQDIAYFNGEQVGATGTGFQEAYWNMPREYIVPGNLVKAGKNVIAVRVYSFVYDGGMIGPVDKMRTVPVDASAVAIALSGDWQYQVEHDFGVVAGAQMLTGPGNQNSPYMLFDSMIAPLLPYALRGAIWYQGESNSNNAGQYRRMMSDMIRDWRFHWGLGDFQFIQTQLANFLPGDTEDWPRLREAQLQVLAEPNTGMAVAIDIGEATNIHPFNKYEVGRRLSLWALADTYGQPVVPSGPLYKSMSIEANKIRLRFDYVGGGLVAKGGKLTGFAIVANGSQEFRQAQAEIDGDTIVVSHPDIDQPLEVRYAWHANPECNLYNQAGLPASPFRTDNWAI